MSFGGGGFGGFGQQNNTTQQPSGFGGFGSSTTNTGSGFGAAANTSGFGAAANTTSTGGGLFGSTGGAGSFGGASTGGGFGQTNSAFGAKPAFGASTTSTPGGGLFGASTTPAATGTTGGFGAFGQQTNTASTSTPFGGGGSSLFGGNKPASTFGSTTTPAAGGSLFGGSAATTGGFGTSGSAFGGATNNPGLGVVGDPPGTAQVPFAATNEKEPSNPSQTNSYQNILFQEPYKKWSSEELRLADYNQGRRFGNAAGGSGTFGVSSGFGGTGFGTNTTTASTGFGATNNGPGLFGQTQPATGGFGQTATNTTGGFGSSAGGGLFGAKPAGTGLFGNTPAQPAQTTGLFGSSGTSGFGSTANTGTGFGSTTNNTAGGGLFGNTANQAKPAGFSFGNAAPAAAGGFGSTNTTGGFGSTTNTTTNAGGGLFGQTNAQQPAATGGMFGNTQQQNTGTGFGASGGFGQQNNNAAGGGLFGQQKPAGTGMFGSTNTTATNTGGGLFGQTNTTATNSNPFGAAINTSNNTAPGNSLFGSKPATTGTGMFGSTPQQGGTTGGGLFGSLGQNAQQQQQPAASGGMFGSLGQNQQQKPSPFGSTLGQSTGGGLFGNQNNQQSGGLFGNSNQQQQQQGGLGGSMFGGSQNQQQPQSLSTSINDLSAYGSTSLFAGLGNNEAQNPGPLATPLNGNKNKVKSRSILPMYKLSPANATRFVTPVKRGFGFSYSTYGTPSSVSSVSSTPGGLGQSLLMGNNNRGLAKSISTSSLRRSFNVEDSILAPGSFSASSGSRAVGGHKKLVINKDMRSDLFTSPNKSLAQDANGARKLTKRVSFETSSNSRAPENGHQGSGSNTPDESSDRDLGYIRPSSRQSNGTYGANPAPPSDAPEMEQVKGNELAIVHEEEPAAAPPVRVNPAGDNEPGEYWMYPAKEVIQGMNRVQRQKVENFAVGRENVGSVSFKVPVDLSNIDLDELYGNIVILEPRSATVYPVAAKKPPVGKGLNVPATISLEQSWPRARDKRTPVQDKSGSRIAKHIERLKRIENTTFQGYNPDLGIWTFSVEHFTTYGLDDDDDDDDETEADVAPPPSKDVQQVRESPYADYASPDVDPDDTFDFKRSRRAVPGAFDDGTALSDDEEMGDSDHDRDQLQQRRASPEPEMAEVREEYDAPRQDDESMGEGYEEEGRELVRVPSSAGESVRHDEEEGEMGDYQLSRSAGNDDQVPAGIMRARMRAIKKSTAPTKIQVAGGDDWTQILQQSVRAPRRMDRATLRALNESGAAWENLEERGSPAPKQQSAADTAGFATSIDLMKSLFAESKGPPAQSVQGMAGKGFVKWPYQRRDKVAHEDDEQELAFRSAARVEWGPRGTAVTTVNDGEVAQSQIIINKAVEGEELESVPNLQRQMDQTEIKSVNGVPTVMSQGPVAVKSLASGDDKVWELASVLFDNHGADLSKFWEKLVAKATEESMAKAKTHEEKAIACLAGNRPAEACKHLLAGRNFRLATLVAAVGANEAAKRDVREQLKNWAESNALSEFSEPIRAIYEILAGNTCVCQGTKNAPIENRIQSFVISDRFDLDWMQAFGLRLWHNGESSVSDAVCAFATDVEQDREPEPNSPLWALLKLFADGRVVNYGDYTLSWQLTRALYVNGNVSFGDEAEEKLDAMTHTFASHLLAKGAWVQALFVLIHLSSPSAREAAIREQLGRNAGLIDDKDKDRVLSTLTQTLKIPAAWVYEAKALHARSVLRDPVAEFAYLLLAEDWLEANRTFLSRVAPSCVIRREYADLFEYASLLYRIRDKIPGFSQGAAVYLLFPATKAWDGPGLPSWVENLTSGLVALRANTSDESLLEIAAISDMAEDLVRVGQRVWKSGGGGEAARLYKMAGGLPMTEDRRQKYLRDLVFEGMAAVGGQ